MDSRVKLPIPAQLPERCECKLCGLKFLSETSKDNHMAKNCSVPSSGPYKLPNPPSEPYKLPNPPSGPYKLPNPSSEPYKLPNPSSQPLKPLVPSYEPQRPPVSNNLPLPFNNSQTHDTKSSSDTQEQTPHSSKDHPPLRPIIMGQNITRNSAYPPLHLNFHQQTAEPTCIQDTCKEEKQPKKILARQTGNKSRSTSLSEHIEDTIHSPFQVESHYQVFAPKPSNKPTQFASPQREEEEIYTNLGSSADNLRLMQEVKDLKVTNEKLRVENKELKKRNSKSDGIIDDFSFRNKQLQEKLAKQEFLLNSYQDLQGIEKVYENSNPSYPQPYTRKK